jgi:hypothetical protein
MSRDTAILNVYHIAFENNPTLNSGGPLKHVCVGETCRVAEPNPESLAMTMVKL